MPSRSKADLHPMLVEIYNKTEAEFANKYPNAPQPFITCTYRSNEEQNALYAIGRTATGRKVTNAKAGQSPHNFKPSRAFDIAFIGLDKKLDWSPELFRNFAAIGKAQSDALQWGGDFKSIPDAPHFELKGWKEIK